MDSVTESWKDVAVKAQAFRDATLALVDPPVGEVQASLPSNVTAIPKQMLSKPEIEITEMLTEDLVESLSSGRLSSLKVTKAFLRRAVIAQKLTNCVTEILSEAALRRAKYCDDYLAKSGKPLGPLHGLPISIKEHISMKDLGLNCGFVGWWDRVGTADAHILQCLRKAGAVFYVRTTEPQCLMHLETSNNLYGVTVNPYNRDLTAGGSSGGEGALIGLRGSCLGVGTDIGGSIRSPAANNGIWGLRPSSFRIPLKGSTAPMAGYEQIIPVLGPLSTSFGGICLFMKAVIDQKPWLTEPSLLPIPWNYPPNSSLLSKPDGSKKLKIGIMWHDGVVKPHPPISRALHELSAKLTSDPNVELVDWQPYKHDEAWKIISSLYFPDGGSEDIEAMALSNEPWLPLTRFIISDQPTVKECTVAELWSRTEQRDLYRIAYAAHWNNSNISPESSYPVDVILSPVGPGAAPPLDHARYWGYTSQWNLLDYPAIVFPVSTVDQTKDQPELDYRPMNEQDEWNWKLYTGPNRYEHAPISLQLIGRRYEDEKVCEAIQWIKSITG